MFAFFFSYSFTLYAIVFVLFYYIFAYIRLLHSHSLNLQKETITLFTPPCKVITIGWINLIFLTPIILFLGWVKVVFHLIVHVFVSLVLFLVSLAWWGFSKLVSCSIRCAKTWELCQNLSPFNKELCDVEGKLLVWYVNMPNNI